MRKLSRAASGSRHHRWSSEIHRTMVAHLEVNTGLTGDQKNALADEATILKPRVEALEAAVFPYRAFVERAHLDIRARQRVANFLCDDAQRTADGAMRPHRKEIDAILPGGFGAILAKTPLSRVLRAGHEKTVEHAERAASALRSLPAKIPGTGPLADALDQAANLLRTFNKAADQLEEQRHPLKSAVNKAIFDLRETLDQIDGRLRTHFSQAFIDSLYPELNRAGTAVADEDDEDDDGSAPPNA
ncbi:hypothetical protein [Polyangium spumosum]|uniref:Uncharacterized protein n=1 Tax=Polyangium spumosum TaxID=889282 RepID=A0A6N7PIY9_9BACT|nr:hypothetical protein [Polyangium spumosum]MRG90796.1 hypothetical protein [Polyangium spumosum]